jgi:hypothetical protein
MSTKDAITKGIGAHGLWKQRLLDAIKNGQSEWTPEIVCQDNQCEFGKWLYACSGEEKSSAHYGKIKDLHANFHKCASNVLKLALTGKKSEAEGAIGDGSDYKNISAALTKEMMSWRSDLG